MKKIMMIFGTRPEAIKMCPLVHELRKHSCFQVTVCVSGQHREMLEQVLNAFDITPEYDMKIMKKNQNLFDITTDILKKIKDIYEKERPDLVLVHGDTTTAFASSLAAFYLNIPVGHVEAGLRTYNIYSPFPEEFNRQAIGITAKYNFAPTEKAKENLLNEQKPPESIYVTGNTAIDALKTTVRENYSHPLLDWAQGSRLILLTAHRRENLGQPMRQMFRAILRVVERYPDVKVVYPVHLNPLVREAADEIFGENQRVKLVEPLDVVDFHNFMAKSHIILTDSGGIQEEAPSLKKPVLVMRNTTERAEGVRAGITKLVGTDEENIFRECCSLLDSEKEYSAMITDTNPYGDGLASSRIAEIIKETMKA